jgi:hypothetical protein
MYHLLLPSLSLMIVERMPQADALLNPHTLFILFAVGGGGGRGEGGGQGGTFELRTTPSYFFRTFVLVIFANLINKFEGV